jgi:predicted dehydrogenase
VLATTATEAGLADITWCFDTVPDIRERFAGEIGCRSASSLEELLEDPTLDGVLIATPHSTHPALVEQVATAGKHVFIEKPLALTVAGASRAMTAADTAHVVLQVGHGRRRQPANRLIKKLLEGGELGRLLQLEATYTSPNALISALPQWRLDPAESPAGSMTALGVHMVDTFHYLAGKATRVTAFSKRVQGDGGIDDSTQVLIEYERGALGHINTSYFVPPVVTLAVYGTAGVAWNEDDGGRLFIQGIHDTTRSEHEVQAPDVVRDELREFVRCIQEGATPETAGPEGIEVAAVLEAIVESARSGRTVDL